MCCFGEGSLAKGERAVVGRRKEERSESESSGSGQELEKRIVLRVVTWMLSLLVEAPYAEPKRQLQASLQLVLDGLRSVLRRHQLELQAQLEATVIRVLRTFYILFALRAITTNYIAYATNHQPL